MPLEIYPKSILSILEKRSSSLAFLFLKIFFLSFFQYCSSRLRRICCSFSQMHKSFIISPPLVWLPPEVLFVWTERSLVGLSVAELSRFMWNNDDLCKAIDFRMPLSRLTVSLLKYFAFSFVKIFSAFFNILCSRSKSSSKLSKYVCDSTSSFSDPITILYKQCDNCWT